MRILLDGVLPLCYNNRILYDDWRSMNMSVQELTALLAAFLREEVLAHCIAEGDAIVLRFTDDSVRIIRVQ